jgi:yecA family protein
MTMNKADTQLLAKFLDNPERPDGTLRLHELQGFLFAIASSPETSAPSEWLPMIGNDEGLDFADQNEAQPSWSCPSSDRKSWRMLTTRT